MWSDQAAIERFFCVPQNEGSLAGSRPSSYRKFVRVERKISCREKL
jgi:hypothetical protein